MILILSDKGGFMLEEAKLGPYELRALHDAGVQLFKQANYSFHIGEVQARDAPPIGSSFGETGFDQVEGKAYEIKWTELPLFNFEQAGFDLTADPESNRKVNVVDAETVKKEEKATQEENVATRGVAAKEAGQRKQQADAARPKV